jgi:hypothetical protein
MPDEQWSSERARRVLDEAADRLASGVGMSDRTLGRLALLKSEESAADEESFSRALRDAGWGRRRIDAALAKVRRSQPLAVRANGMADRALLKIARIHYAWMILAFIVLRGWAVAPLVLWVGSNFAVATRRAHAVLLERARQKRARRARREHSPSADGRGR